MRKSLLYGILENIQYNQNRQQSSLKLFEFGKTYQKLENGFSESKQLILAITGKKHLERWNSGNEQVDYFSLKGYLDALFSRLGLLKHCTFDAINSEYFSDGQSIKIQGKLVAELGILNPKLQKQFDVKQVVYVSIIQWDTVIELLKLNSIKYQEIPKTFAVRRDFSLLINKEITFDQISQSAKKVEKKLLKSVELFDVYEGKNLEEGKKSYAVSFHFQDNESTLTDQTVDQIMEKIRKSLETEVSAQLR
jgi:phenylalanyl-tRNA synthetase beta chain